MYATLILGLVLSPTSGFTTSPDELTDILANVREAVAYDKLRAQPLRGQGKALRYGAEGAFLLELHPDGAFRNAVTGPLPGTLASNGKAVWETDWSGLPSELELGRRERAILIAAVLSGRWLDRGAGFVIALPKEEGEDDSVELDLSMADGLEHASVLLDPESHLVREIDFGETTWHIEDYRTAHGFPFPHRLRAVEDEGMEHTQQLTSLELAVDMKPTDMVRPDPPDDVRIDPAASVVVESKLAQTGHLLVHPRLSGKDVGWFILDTGAGGMCITPSVSAELKMPLLGEVTASGIGGKVPAPVRRGGELQIGPLTLVGPTWVELDLEFLDAIFGVPIAGIIGYDFFARAVVAIDMVTPRVEVHAAADEAVAGGTGWARLVLSEHLPCVEASFEGDRKAVFRIDTGAVGTVVYHHSAVERWGLLDDRTVSKSRSGGVGGFVTVLSGELSWFELSGHRFEPVEATFEPKPGPLAVSPHVAGTIGGGLLEPFTMVLDYKTRRVAFVPRADH